MKKVICIALLIGFSVTLTSAQSKTKSIAISGSIKNLNLDTIAIVNSINNSVYKIGVDKSGTFKYSGILPEGYYNLSFQREYTSIFLKPGFDLNVTADLSNLDQSVTYTGNGSNENNYLAKKYLANAEYMQMNPASNQGTLTEEDFIKQNAGAKAVKDSLLNATKNLDENFKFLEKNNIAFDSKNDIFNFPMMMRYQMGQTDFKTSATYPDPFKSLDVNNEKLLSAPSYSQVVLNYIYSINSEKMIAGNEKDLGTGMLATLDSLVQNNKVKSFMAVQIAQQLIDKTNNTEAFYNKFISIVNDESQRAPITEKYLALKSVQKGMPSPDFSFTDMNGKFFSLKDFKGKYIYIDVWATWCGPCKVEIPFLKTLEEELHNSQVAFVSICTFDEKEKWEVMVKDKDLKGVQLFAPKNNEFVKKYNIQGIPRFLIIDKEGKIFDSNAKRPSDPSLKDDLIALP